MPCVTFRKVPEVVEKKTYRFEPLLHIFAGKGGIMRLFLPSVVVFLMGTVSQIPVVSASEVSVQARAIPETCELVYRVETDFIVSWVGQAIAPAGKVTLVYAFQDAYGQNGNWIGEKTVPMTVDRNGTWSLKMTEQTMAVSGSYLFREMNFYFLVTDTSGEVRRVPGAGPKNPVYRAYFGREFGELCYPDGRQSTPFRPRRVELAELRG